MISRLSSRRRVLAATLLLALGGPGAGWSLPLEIRGLSRELEEQLKATLSAAHYADQPTPETVEYLLDKIPDEVARALEPYGYYGPTTHAEARRRGGKTSFRLKIDPGPPTLIDSVRIEYLADGTAVADPGVGRDRFPLKPGDQLNHARYEAGKRAIEDALANQGYLDARTVVHRVAVRRRDSRADVELTWELGPKSHFGPVSFTGSPLNDAIMRRYVPFETGDPFSRDKLLLLTQRLLDSGYFDRVEVKPDRDQGLEVPVLVEIVPAARSRYRAGLSYGTDSGPGVEAEWLRRWLNARGHRGTLRTELSTKRALVGTEYTIPQRGSSESYYQAALSWLDEDTDSSESTSVRLSLSRLRPWRDWRRVDTVSLLSERSTIAGNTETSRFVLPSVSLSRKRGAEKLIPESGYVLRATVRAAAEALASETSLVQLDLEAKKIFALSSAQRVLLRARAAATWTEDFDVLPASLRYFAGGDRSIRGYDFESLGPKDENGEVIGGRFLLVGSAEYERTVRGNWRAATFLDFGNAFSRGGGELEAGAGVGLRYATPIGLIRLDLAFPVTESGANPRVHLVVGPDL